MRRLPRALAVAGAGLALAGSAFAADQIAGRDRPPASATVTIASSVPLFTEQGLVSGQTFDRCTVLTNQGPQPADVTFFGSASQSDLSPWLELELVRGSIPDWTITGDCTGFTPDAADYGSGTPGVVYRGTLASLPDAAAGIADPARWAVGEQHAYRLRIHYTGNNPQQGLSTVQTFSWGATPFDDRPPDPFLDPSQRPGGAGGTAAAAGAGAGALAIGRQCRVVSFPSRSYIGARAMTRPKRTAKASGQSLGSLTSSASGVIAAGEDPVTLGRREIHRRKALLRYTRLTGARRTPVLVVRLAPGKGDRLALRVGLRKRGELTSPRRWRWVRVRLNSMPTKSTVRWPFTAAAQMSQLRVGYNQLDLTLNRGIKHERLKGLPRLLRRSFAFIVAEPSGTAGGGSDCTLG